MHRRSACGWLALGRGQAYRTVLRKVNLLVPRVASPPAQALGPAAWHTTACLRAGVPVVLGGVVGVCKDDLTRRKGQRKWIRWAYRTGRNSISVASCLARTWCARCSEAPVVNGGAARQVAAQQVAPQQLRSAQRSRPTCTAHLLREAAHLHVAELGCLGPTH